MSAGGGPRGGHSALFLLVSYPSILTAHWLPLGLRLPHAMEILADSVVYAYVVVALLRPRGDMRYDRTL